MTKQPDGTVPGRDLTEVERQILLFEGQGWSRARPGAKEQAIRDLFDLSSTRYHQLLSQIIDKPEALARQPVVVNRLRRMRTSRQRSRLHRAISGA